MARTSKIPYLEIIKKNQEGMSIPELAKIYGIKQTYIYGYLHRRGLKANPMIQDRRKNKPIDNILDYIDSEEKAYFIGIMLADGYITNNITRGYKYENFGMFLKQEDSFLINKICSLLGIRSSIRKDNKMIGFCVSSKKIISRLNELGVVKNKTYTNIKIPKLNDNLISHFIRGYFDGDGSVSIRKSRPNQIQVYICGICKEFLQEISNILKKSGIKSLIYEENRGKKGHKTMYTLRVTTHKDRCLFFEYLYKNSTIYLDRKYTKFKKYYDNTELSSTITKGVETV